MLEPRQFLLPAPSSLLAMPAPVAMPAQLRSAASAISAAAFHFGFTVTCLADLTKFAKQLKRRADSLSEKDNKKSEASLLKLRQEKHATYLLAGLFWMELSERSLVPEVSNSSTEIVADPSLLSILTLLSMAVPFLVVDVLLCSPLIDLRQQCLQAS
jgi:hypothetical protein